MIQQPVIAADREAATVTAVLYLRVSTADQGRRGYSLPEQRKGCLERLSTILRTKELERGGSIRSEVFEFVDTSSGDLIERPELERARQFVKESRPTHFICLDPDRFSRATYQAILVADEIEAAGTKLEFVQHDYQATSEGRLFFTLRVAIAEYEKAKILERTRRGKRGKIAAGGIPIRINAYGYRFIPEAERQVEVKQNKPDLGQLVPDPVEAAWVEQMFNWVVNEEIGSQAIAERLNTLAVPSKNGSQWWRGVVADILRNPLYIGKLRLNRWDFTGLGPQLQLPKDRRTKKLTPKQRPSEEWVYVDVPAIIADELFNRVQACLTNMKRRSGTRLHPGRKGHLLSGLVTCGVCGAPLYYVWNNKIAGYYLRCANRYPLVRGLEKPLLSCSAPHQRAAHFERALWERLKGWFSDPAVLRADLERQAQPMIDDTAVHSHIARTEQLIEEAKTRQTRVLYLVSKGVVHPDVAEAQLAEVKRQLDALETHRNDLRRLAAGTTTTRQIGQVVEMVHEKASHVLHAMDGMPLSERQTLVRMLIKDITILPHGRYKVWPRLQ
jgi:site-specific DNA recombinase